MISFNCPTCGKHLGMDDAVAGQQFQCPCGTNLIVPRATLAAVQSASYPASPAAYPPPPPVSANDKSGQATASLVLGLVGLLAWLLPIVGLPVTIVGLVMGIKGLRSRKRGLAVAGIVLSIIGLVATIINAAIGAYMGATGQYPMTPNYRGR